MCVCVHNDSSSEPSCQGFSPEGTVCFSEASSFLCLFSPCFQPIGEMLSSSEPWPAHMSLPLQAPFPRSLGVDNS